MAIFYNKEKSKLGTLTGSIISFSTQLQSNEPIDANNKKLLPSGYIRCDGSVYSASVFPLLAEVLGTGIDCKFKQTDTFLRNDQFQVPDLLVKHIRASTGSNIGSFNDLEYESTLGDTFKKSGIGLDVLSNVDPVFTLTYSGSFYLPSQTIDLRGQPAFSRTLGDYTELSEIPDLSIIPHAHFSTTVRSRTINFGGLNTAINQNNFNRKTSTLNVCSWYKNTYQILCQHSAETAAGYPTRTFTRSFPQNTSNAWKFTNMCLTTCRFNTTGGGSACLIPTSSACPSDSCISTFQWPAQDTSGNYNPRGQTSVLCGGPIVYTATGYLECFSSGFFGGIVSACSYFGESAGDHGTGNPGFVQLSGQYDINTTPFAAGSTTNSGFTGVSNVTTQTTDVGNDATHRHIVPLTPNPHTYAVQTTAQNFSSEGLVSTVSIKTTSEKKADNYIQPYVIVEYLIKV